MKKKLVLAYSGGLDTSVLIKWMAEQYDADIVACAIDVGEERQYEEIRQKALKIGAVASYVVDAKQEFVERFIWPALSANALYEGKYPLFTALARYIIAEKIVEIARKEGASGVAHGSTGKGNDQVRFEVSFMSLAPDLERYAPMREWGMTREKEIEYAQSKGIPVPVTKSSPYSIDTNLWGRSMEAGVIEDPWREPPADAYLWTTAPEEAPDEPEYVEIEFQSGVPVALNGETLDGVELISRLNKLAGKHGVGRIDMMENRLVGIKSRETYETPAATVLIKAHQDLESLTLDRETLHFKAPLEQRFSELVYYGLWYSPLREALSAFFANTQQRVNGTVRMKLYKGSAVVVGRKSPNSLYKFELSTYDAGDVFDQSLSRGFIELWGLPSKIAYQARIPGQEGEG
jgi:argininosuccinate synthase